MANFKPRIKGYNKLVINNTEIDQCMDNYIIFSIDTEQKNINYTINKKHIKNFYNKILCLFNEKGKTFSIKETYELLDDDIYSIYKTKVSQKRIPQILLNILILNNLLKSEDGIDFTTTKSKETIISFLNTL